MASTSIQNRGGPDPEEEPSVDWGWHGSFPNGKRIAGWTSVVFLLVMITINYDGLEFEDWALIILGVWLIAALVREELAHRR